MSLPTLLLESNNINIVELYMLLVDGSWVTTIRLGIAKDKNASVQRYTGIVGNIRYLKPTDIVNSNIEISCNLRITCHLASTFFMAKMADFTDTVGVLVQKKAVSQLWDHFSQFENVKERMINSDVAICC